MTLGREEPTGADKWSVWDNQWHEMRQHLSCCWWCWTCVIVVIKKGLNEDEYPMDFKDLTCTFREFLWLLVIRIVRWIFVVVSNPYSCDYCYLKSGAGNAWPSQLSETCELRPDSDLWMSLSDILGRVDPMGSELISIKQLFYCKDGAPELNCGTVGVTSDWWWHSNTCVT